MAAFRPGAGLGLRYRSKPRLSIWGGLRRSARKPAAMVVFAAGFGPLGCPGTAQI